jgi:hypothetical protein
MAGSPADQAKGIYVHGEPVTAHPVHGGLIPTHGGVLGPVHGSDNVAPYGPELVNNGTFNSSTSGWTAIGNTAILLDSQRLKVTSSVGDPGSGASQTITGLEIGETYNVRATMTPGNTADMGRFGLSGASVLSFQVAATPNVDTTFVATTDILGISCLIASAGAWGAAGNYCYFDSISVRKVN